MIWIPTIISLVSVILSWRAYKISRASYIDGRELGRDNLYNSLLDELESALGKLEIAVYEDSQRAYGGQILNIKNASNHYHNLCNITEKLSSMEREYGDVLNRSNSLLIKTEQLKLKLENLNYLSKFAK